MPAVDATRTLGDQMKRVCIGFLAMWVCGCPGDPPPPPSGCTADEQCASLDTDGDLCNGTFLCKAGQCLADDTVVSCSTSNQCATAACNPQTGSCETTPVADGTTCNDTDPCTTADSCTDGTCGSTTATCPDDSDPCTTTTCDPESGACNAVAGNDFDPCDDGDGCTENDTCLSGACAGSAKLCPEDDNVCTAALCAAGECGQAPGNAGGECDDGDLCTSMGSCANGACSAGEPKCAQDDLPCATVSCDADTGDCVETPIADGELCDDKDPCTLNDSCLAGGCLGGVPKCTQKPSECEDPACEPGTGECIGTPVAGTPDCDDGNACTVDDVCGEGACKGQPLQCEQDEEPCTVAVCVGGDCESTPIEEGTKCDDDDICTDDDLCVAGVCTGAYCDDGNSCTIEVCNAITGDCSSVPQSDGAVCDDGNPCTGDGVCETEECTTGAPITCDDDGDPCTQEVCSVVDGCFSTPAPESAACDDSNPCTTGEICTGGSCGGGEATQCPDDGDACTLEACDELLGCVAAKLPDDEACDDSNACTSGDVCKKGKCTGASVECVASGPCKSPLCDPTDGCVESDLPPGTPCEDDDLCTSETTCTDGVCGGGKLPTCPQPGADCLIGFCLAETGSCTTGPAVDGTVCDDGDLCSTDDICDKGACLAGAPIDCGFAIGGCVDLTCDPNTGDCDATPLEEGAPCNVGNPCADAGVCTDGQCSGAQTVSCPAPADPCTVAFCDSKTGDCVEAPALEEAACDDGDPCTMDTFCVGGACTGGAATPCPDDGDTCTLEECVAGEGCSFKPAEDGVACGDGDVCTDETTCSGGKCQGGKTATCPPDGNPCTADTCVTGLGCTYEAMADGAACDDGSKCTTPDQCTDGECVGQIAVACSPTEDFCSPNVCDPATGVCFPEPVDDGKVCNDENPCTVKDVCSAGVCLGVALNCPDDDDVCTVAVCDPGPGKCVQAPADSGVPCDDEKHCTVDDACDGLGQCAGAPKDCPVPDQLCVEATCDPKDGTCGVIVSANGTPCADDDPCAIGDICLGGACAPGALPKCLPSSACVTAACDADSGDCTQTPLANDSDCDDLNACTTGEACQGGACVGGAVTACDPIAADCLEPICNTVTGVCEPKPVAVGLPCDDSDPCTEPDSCLDGACSGVTVTCDDPASVCATAACDSAAGGCVETALEDGQACDDADVCTTGDVCVSGACDGAPKTCPTAGSDCQFNVCKPGIGCVGEDANEGGLCADNVCFIGSTCAAGQCVGGDSLVCNVPENPCETAVCDTEAGCGTTKKDDGTVCDDGSLCTTLTTCADGVCEGQQVSCPQPPPCHVALCDKALGCITQKATDGTACEDGAPCTLGDTCSDGACTTGTPKTCDAGSECSPEICDVATGLCVSTAADDGTECEDGDPCNTGSACQGGQCQGGSAVVCEPSGDPCLVTACSPDTGACIDLPAADGIACDDKSLCTTEDACKAGVCTGALAVVCNAPNGCLFNECEAATGSCVPFLAPDGAPCDDGNPCSVGEACDVGQCTGGAPAVGCCAVDADCDDGTPCTADACTGGQCAYSEVALPACVARIVVAGQDDAELTILNAETFAVVGSASVPGTVHDLAGADGAGVVFATVPDAPASVLAIDVLQPSAQPPAPVPATPSRVVAVAPSLGLLAVVGSDGSATTWNVQTALQMASGQAIAPPIGTPTLEPETGRLFIPSELGSLAVLELAAPMSQAPTTPYFVGGNPTAAVYAADQERVFMADPKAEGVRVVGALHGSGLQGDSLTGLGVPAGLDVDLANGTLLVAYPAGNVVRVFSLDTLLPAAPPAVAIGDGPTAVTVDPLSDRVYVTSAAGNTLTILGGATLTNIVPPVTVAGGPVDVVVVRSRPGAAIITEVMANPSAVSDPDGEWFEVHNPGTTAIDLNGWTLETDAAFHTVTQSVPIPAGGRAVLCRNGNAAENGGVTCDYAYTGLPLTNTGVNLSLRSAASVLVDTAGLSAPIPTGKSLALRHPAYNNLRRYSWSDSDGTPGAANEDVGDTL